MVFISIKDLRTKESNQRLFETLHWVIIKVKFNTLDQFDLVFPAVPVCSALPLSFMQILH